ncbi:Twinfilin-1 [Coemansia sp. Benny D115]|nr:Twinfilin-1 [Coemansia sp. Benny D115]
MAHQSGIRVSEALARAFHEALASDTTRAIKVNIVAESLDNTATLAAQGSFADDMAGIPGLLEPGQPSYVLVRQEQGRWLVCSYVPDTAPVRSKMLYASSKAALTKGLGESLFVDEIFGTTPDEFSTEGYARHRRHQESQAPLTEREQEMQRVRDMEAREAHPVTMDSRRMHVSGAKVPFADNLPDALHRYRQGSINLLTLLFDTEREVFDVDQQTDIQDHAELVSCVPEDSPRYILYWLNSSTSVFVYSCPSASNIKERMVYSSFKYGFLVTIKDMGIDVHAKIEVDNPREDLAPESLLDEVAERTRLPAKHAHIAKPKFSRPAPPARRPRTTADN